MLIAVAIGLLALAEKIYEAWDRHEAELGEQDWNDRGLP